jgi:ATP-dependent Zn protease
MPERVKAIAYHEAGHAIAMLRCGVKIATCTINNSEDDGYGRTIPADHQNATDRQQLMIAWAGPFAQMRVDPYADVVSSDQQELKKVLHDFRGSRLDMIDELYKAAREACELVEREWRFIERIAEALLAKETLSGEELERLIRH